MRTGSGLSGLIRRRRLWHDIKQQIDIITPHYTRIMSSNHEWAAYYLTQELGVEKVRKLLSTHPDFTEKGGMADAGKRAKLIRFLIQCEWWIEAEYEIDRMLKDLPGENQTGRRIPRNDSELAPGKDGRRHRTRQGCRPARFCP